MKTMLAILVLMAPLSTFANDEASKKDLVAMQGDWALEQLTQDGKPSSSEETEVLFRTIKGDKYTVFIFNRAVDSGSIVIDATKKPATIDMLGSRAKGKPTLGVYKIEGDKLTICYAAPGAKRPTELASKEGSGHTLMVWKREKKQEK